MRCPRKDCTNEANHSPTFGVLPCDRCQDLDAKIRVPKSPEFYSLRKSHRVQKIRDKHEKDLLQPYIGNKANKEYFHAYPDQVKDYGVQSELEKG